MLFLVFTHHFAFYRLRDKQKILPSSKEKLESNAKSFTIDNVWAMVNDFERFINFCWLCMELFGNAAVII